ncbi:MAG: hypothetical protein A3I76_07415 [Elusimicrobia bacterium RIFCSPLOWO2_02_FULL_61_11]|nr:MAG: hypothetical protein A3I76_07415 [Elusimicrobia bacterium RIFCSPLOWO2_02_FULL_61_11]
MEEEKKGAGWKIWIYLSPVYIILGMLLFRWNAKINSSDVGLSKEEYNAFNASEGEIKKRQNADYDPNLTDIGYNVRYRTGKEEESGLPENAPGTQAAVQAEKAAAGKRAQDQKAAASGESGQAGTGKSANQLALESNETKAKEAMGMGNKVGYLSYAVGKVMNNPKAVGALLNNKYVVNGFMARGTVKAATASPEGLANYLKSGGPANFLNNPVVKSALNTPAIVGAVASSGIVAAMLNTPAAMALMNNPQALGDLINNNPQLVALAMQNPQTLTMLMSNPEVSGLVGKFDTSKIKKF